MKELAETTDEEAKRKAYEETFEYEYPNELEDIEDEKMHRTIKKTKRQYYE